MPSSHRPFPLIPRTLHSPNGCTISTSRARDFDVKNPSHNISPAAGQFRALPPRLPPRLAENRRPPAASPSRGGGEMLLLIAVSWGLVAVAAVLAGYVFGAAAHALVRALGQ
jgi:hypothetical protein